MKTKEILAGGAYAFASRDWEARSRVVVIAVGIERQAPYSVRETKDGVRVRNDSGAEFTASSREIREPWAHYETRKAIAEERSRVQRERQEKDKAETAEVVAMLAAAGVITARAAGMGVVVPSESFGSLAALCGDAHLWRRLNVGSAAD